MTTSIVWHFQCQFRLLPQKNLKKYMMNCITKVTMMILETFTTTQSVNVHKEINRLIIMIRTIIYTKNKSFCLKTSMVCPMFRYQHSISKTNQILRTNRDDLIYLVIIRINVFLYLFPYYINLLTLITKE